jgi:hypothetical protein
MTRRSLFKALLGLPVVAAIPQTSIAEIPPKPQGTWALTSSTGSLVWVRTFNIGVMSINEVRHLETLRERTLRGDETLK